MVTTNMPESGARIGFAAETMMATSLPKTDCGVKRVRARLIAGYWAARTGRSRCTCS